MSTEISGFANQQNETVQRQNTEDKSFNVLDDQSSDVECSIRWVLLFVMMILIFSH